MLSHHMHNSCPGESSRYAVALVWVRNISSFLFAGFFSIVLNHHDFGIICYHGKTLTNLNTAEIDTRFGVL